MPTILLSFNGERKYIMNQQRRTTYALTQKVNWDLSCGYDELNRLVVIAVVVRFDVELNAWRWAKCDSYAVSRSGEMIQCHNQSLAK